MTSTALTLEVLCSGLRPTAWPVSHRVHTTPVCINQPASYMQMLQCTRQYERLLGGSAHPVQDTPGQ